MTSENMRKCKMPSDACAGLTYCILWRIDMDLNTCLRVRASVTDLNKDKFPFCFLQNLCAGDHLYSPESSGTWLSVLEMATVTTVYNVD